MPFYHPERIRPVLTFNGPSPGCSSTTLDNAAASVELIHAYSLIHDVCPQWMMMTYEEDVQLVIRSLTKTAILAGDTLQALAFEVLVKEANDMITPSTKVKMVKILASSSGVFGMAGSSR